MGQGYDDDDADISVCVMRQNLRITDQFRALILVFDNCSLFNIPLWPRKLACFMSVPTLQWPTYLCFISIIASGCNMRITSLYH